MATEDPNATDHRIKCGVRLEQSIIALGTSQAKIAAEFGVSASRLGHWIRGRHYPDPYFLYQFCKTYSVTADWIYRGVVFGLPETLAAGLRQQKQESLAEPPVEGLPACEMNTP